MLATRMYSKFSINDTIEEIHNLEDLFTTANPEIVKVVEGEVISRDRLFDLYLDTNKNVRLIISKNNGKNDEFYRTEKDSNTYHGLLDRMSRGDIIYEVKDNGKFDFIAALIVMWKGVLSPTLTLPDDKEIHNNIVNGIIMYLGMCLDRPVLEGTRDRLYELLNNRKSA